MYRFASNEPTDADEVRTRLRKMSDGQLLRFGKAAAFMCSPRANFNEPPREAFVIQLREARAEWRRVIPMLPANNSNPRTFALRWEQTEQEPDSASLAPGSATQGQPLDKTKPKRTARSAMLIAAVPSVFSNSSVSSGPRCPRRLRAHISPPERVTYVLNPHHPLAPVAVLQS